MKMVYRCLAVLLSVSGYAYANEPQQLYIEETRVNAVFVNGGADSANSGTTCIRVAENIDTTCTGNIMAIPNNNSELFSASLAAKATGGKTWVYFIADENAQQHCPGTVFTPCTLVTIGLIE